MYHFLKLDLSEKVQTLIQNQDKIPVLFYTTVKFSIKTKFPELRHEKMSVQSSLHTRKLMATVTTILSQTLGKGSPMVTVI